MKKNLFATLLALVMVLSLAPVSLADCAHEHTYTTVDFDDWNTVQYTSVDNMYHDVTGLGTRSTYCQDCDELLETEEHVQCTERWSHTYDDTGDTVCTECGHQNTCPHENTYNEWSFDNWDTVVYTSVDDQYHTATGDGETYDYCEDCGQRLNVVKVPNMTQKMYHGYDDNGVCEQCGYENACPHENTYNDWSFDNWGTVTYTFVDDQYHTATGDGETYDYCQDCGERINVVKVLNMIQKMYHSYDDNGVCEQCGYENACPHENTYDEWSFDNWDTVVYTSVDDQYHTATGDGETYDYCEDCGQRLNVVKVPNMTQKMYHGYDDNGVCEQCGYENACPHENTYTDWDFDDWDTVIYTSVDDQYHTATGDGETYDYCEDCGQRLNVVKASNMTKEMYHDYDDNGVCERCGHKNTCSHANTYNEQSFDNWDTVTYTFVDNQYHTATGDGEISSYCEDCGQRLNVVKVPNMTQEVEHDYDANGVCEQCGYQNACIHANKYANWTLTDWDAATYISVDDRTHVVHGAGETYDYCRDCGQRLNVVAVTDVNVEEQHWYDDNGVCERCGHQNACAHVNTHSSWSFDNWDAVTYTSVDDQFHTATGDGETYDYCEDCGERINVVIVSNMTQKMAHDYDDNGACQECGHENACTHENVKTEICFEDGDEVTYTSVDDENHAVSGAGWEITWCEDCGIMLSEELLQKATQTESHAFDEVSECSACGLSKLTTIYPICEVVNGEDKLVFFNNGVLYFEKEDGETLHGWWRLPDGKLKVHLDVPGKVARANGLVVKIGITAYTITEEQMAELIRCLDVE